MCTKIFPGFPHTFNYSRAASRGRAGAVSMDPYRHLVWET